MPRKAEDPMEMILMDIEHKLNLTLVDMATEITNLTELAYESVIQSFYDDYTPRWYKRTYSTFLGSSGYDDPFAISPIDGGFESGITVDNELIKGHPYRADTNWVFTRTFAEGIHGYFKWEMNKWAPQAWKKLNRKYLMSNARKERFAKFLEKSTKHAPRRYRRGQNNIAMVFTTGENLSTTNLTKMQAISTKGFASTPQKAMNNAFRKLTSKQNMDAIYKKYFEQHFKDYLA